MECQKKLFSLKENVHYLNCAYKAPLLKSAEEACLKALIRERNPMEIAIDDFFSNAEKVKIYFAQLINVSDSNNIAIIPSTSYGFTSALNNIKGKISGNAITIQDEFPSGYFSLERWCEENDNELIIVKSDEDKIVLGETWNENLLNQITEQTTVVLISSVHWMNGLKFDLERIGQRCKEFGAKLIVDGTQSVGALPIDVQKYNIDVLVCGTYKWLFGPYSVALAYLSDDFENGKPLEESWINRTNSKNFSSLTEYEDQYIPKSGRYNVGQVSNFVLLPILRESLKQLIEWKPENIQKYCQLLIQPLINYLQDLEVVFEPQKYFSNHLFSLRLPEETDIDLLKKNLMNHQVYLSVRGDFLRVAVNVFNDQKDIEKLIEVIKMTIDNR